jgi:hypothetical protein
MSADARDATSFTPLELFLAEPDEQVPWIVNGLLAVGGLSLVGAKPKVGKSTLARVIAHSVACGTPCLGRETVRGPVLYVSIEEHRRDVRRHFAQLGSADHPDLLVHVGPIPGTPKGTSREAIRRHRLAWLTAEIERFAPVLVTLDTWGRFVAVKDGKDYSEVTEASEQLIVLARSSGAHFNFTHHARKEEGELIDALVGSTAIAGSVDTVMLLRRQRDNVRTIATNQRVGDELDETVLTLDKLTGRLSLAGTLDDARLEAAIQQYVVRLVRVSSATERELRADLTGPTELLVKALRVAVDCGLVTRSGLGKPGNPYRYSLSRTRYQTDHTDETNHTDHTDETCGSSGSPVREGSGAESTDPGRPQSQVELCSCGEPAVAWSAGDGWCAPCWAQRCEP